MAIDFSKRSRNKSVEKKTHPCEIYDTLDRHANKGPLRVPVQNTILSKWFDASSVIDFEYFPDSRPICFDARTYSSQPRRR